MLTYHQVQTVAYMLRDGCEFLCRSCALEALGLDEDGEPSDEVALAESGLGSDEVTAISRFELDEYVGQNASEHANEVADWENDPDAWQEAYDEFPEHEPCGNCGADLD